MATPTLSVSSLKRISEDARLRPFLSPLFDPQAYIKTVIKDGKSEECFNNIVSCIEDINVEIKGYISVHKVCVWIMVFSLMYLKSLACTG